MTWTTSPQSFIAVGFFPGGYKSFLNLIISYVLDHTVSPRILSIRFNSLARRTIILSEIYMKNSIEIRANST